MPCYVCGLQVASTDEHHLIPRSRGGQAGPTVDLCGTCHSSVHDAANAALAGRDWYEYTMYLRDEPGAIRRFTFVVNCILVASAKGKQVNPNPTVSVKLGCSEYLSALHLAKRDRGFTSMEELLNSLAHAAARKYGLIAPNQPVRRPPK